MATTPTGSWIGLPFYHLQTLLANSAQFRTLTGAADVAAARAFIFLAAEPLDPARPFALIKPGENHRLIGVAGGTSITYDASRELVLQIERDVAADKTPNEAFFDFVNIIDQIVSEMMDNSGAGGFLAVQEFSLINISRINRDKRAVMGDRMSIDIGVSIAT